MLIFKKEDILRLTAIALRTRRDLGLSIYENFNIYDSIEKIGIEVQFQNISSMEGMYCNNPGPLILVNSDRPAGRQVFTCAHEFGHHILGHGTSVDELILNDQHHWKNRNEFEADCFAGLFLMPKLSVENAFFVRKLNPNYSTPEHIYIISTSFGVSYSGLITHMNRMLGIISNKHANHLLNYKPINIKEGLTDLKIKSNLVVVDEYWRNRVVDIQVGEYLLSKIETKYTSNNIKCVKKYKNGFLYEGTSPGLGKLRIDNSSKTLLIRVSRKTYFGQNKFRFLEEVDSE